MRITWVTRTLWDYYVPVIAELDRQSGGELHFIYASRWAPQRVKDKLQKALGRRAIAMEGEKSIGIDKPLAANTSVCIPYQPGLLKEISRTGPEVLLGDGFFQWTSVALAHRILHGTPLVVLYERTAYTERASQWFRRAYRRMALRFVDAMCCNGRLCREYSQSLGMDPSRITTPRMAGDSDRLAELSAAFPADQKEQWRRKWSVQGAAYLCVGQLIRRKGIYELLQGWALQEREHPGGQTLLLLGEGPEELPLKKMTESLGLKNVRFLGSVDYDQIAGFYASVDALVMPTLEDNWSLVVPEAMSCGLPILSSQYNGCWPELVQPGNGWVFDPLDPRDIQRCLQLALESRANLPAMGQCSRQIVREYSPAHAAGAIFRACEIAVEHGKRR